MRKTISIAFFLLSFIINAQLNNSYYLPQNQDYDPAIPTPESVLGFTVGEWHVSHDKLSEYMRTLANASDRISIENRGKTYEDRPLLLLTITHPDNHARIEEIRNEHLQLTEKGGENLATENMPAVVYQGFSIHGNEPSGANAGLLVAYHLAASRNEEVLNLLKDVVILFDPSFNPDGLQRFSQWANTHKAENINPDNNDREYSEVWPGGRTNHYWFDMNRDWLPVQLNESKARINSFTQWLPNILTDHHEMGTNETFFFQPGIPSRVNPLTPDMNQKLTKAIGNYHAEALNEIGSLYYTEEDYDDFYYGKGSTYPDINGAVGILFEQGSSRGHAQNTDNGVLTFPFTIRNQFTTALSTLRAAQELRIDLLNHQRKFFEDGRQLGAKSKEKAIVFGNEKDPVTAYKLAEVLKRHDIKIHHLKASFEKNNKKFKAENSFVVPLNQKKHQLIRAMFNRQTTFQDSLFYDVSAWTLPLAFNVNDAIEKDVSRAGAVVESLPVPQDNPTLEKAAYAYVFESHGYLTPKVLYALMEANIRVKVGLQPFVLEGKKYDYGSIMIPVSNQKISPEDLHQTIVRLAKENYILVNTVSTGLTQGIDLGSRNFETLRQPKVGLFVGRGVRSYDAGEIWHLMDTRYDMPVTKLDTDRLGRIDLSGYTHLVLPSYSGKVLDAHVEKLDDWIKQGGVLITYRAAVKWAVKNKLANASFKSEEHIATNISYENRNKYNGAQNIGGAIFNTKLDRSHPVNFGIEQNTLPVFRNTRIFMEADKNSYNNPIQYTNDPLLSGYISAKQLRLLKNTVPLKIERKGRGRIIMMTDNTNFRAFWLGTQKLFGNFLFYGNFM